MTQALYAHMNNKRKKKMQINYGLPRVEENGENGIDF
jgi:hypothetical protein